MSQAPLHLQLRRAVRRRSLEANLFPAAHAAIDDWDAFRWHGGPGESSDTFKAHSSQALTIDVFGTLKVSPHRDRVLGRLAASLGLPPAGPWAVHLEWHDPDNLLKEKTPTRVDAVALSPQAVIYFECKFCESDGSDCGQTRPIARGKHRGLRQCNGLYWPQVNPTNGREARCALTAKGLRYWDFIPDVFLIDPDRSYAPCPFAGAWFQWMRNLTGCVAVAQHRGLRPAFVVVYADAPSLPMAQRVRGAEWARFTRALNPRIVTFSTLSFQSLVALAQSAAPDDDTWPDLAVWVERKIEAVTGLRKDEVVKDEG